MSEHDPEPEPEPQPVAWLESTKLKDAEELVRVAFERRDGHTVFVRQLDPGEPDPPRVPLYPGDAPSMMKPLSYATLHSTPEKGNVSDLIHSMRIVPDRRDGNVLYVRTLRHGETDDGRRVHVGKGDQVVLKMIAELDAIDALEEATQTGFVPLTSVLGTWFSFGPQNWDPNAVRYMLAAARRLDMANEMFIRIMEIEAEVNSERLSGPKLRRRIFEVVGCLELGIISLGRAVSMIHDAPTRFPVVVAMPTTLTSALPAITAIRNAYEHIEDRAFGTVFGDVKDEALSIFDYADVLRDDVIVYGKHRLDLTVQVPAIIADARETIKNLVASSIPPGTVPTQTGD